MFQMGGFGPIPGQVHHFVALKDEAERRYGLERFMAETRRLYTVLDKRLAAHEFSANELSIADFAILGWAWRHERHRVDLADYPTSALVRDDDGAPRGGARLRGRAAPAGVSGRALARGGRATDGPAPGPRPPAAATPPGIGPPSLVQHRVRPPAVLDAGHARRLVSGGSLRSWTISPNPARTRTAARGSATPNPRPGTARRLPGTRSVSSAACRRATAIRCAGSRRPRCGSGRRATGRTRCPKRPRGRPGGCSSASSPAR